MLHDITTYDVFWCQISYANELYCFTLAAFKNRCKYCVGGNTGLVKDEGVDCRGGCGDYALRNVSTEQVSVQRCLKYVTVCIWVKRPFQHIAN